MALPIKKVKAWIKIIDVSGDSDAKSLRGSS